MLRTPCAVRPDHVLLISDNSITIVPQICFFS